MPPLWVVVLLLCVVSLVLGLWREVNLRRKRALEEMEAKRAERRRKREEWWPTPPTHFNCRCVAPDLSIALPLPRIAMPLPSISSIPRLPAINDPMTDDEIAAIMRYLVVGRTDMEYLGDLEVPTGVEPHELWTALSNEGGRPSVLVARATIDFEAVGKASGGRPPAGLVFHLYTPDEDQHGRPGP